jgi:hypothetical protein
MKGLGSQRIILAREITAPGILSMTHRPGLTASMARLLASMGQLNMLIAEMMKV